MTMGLFQKLMHFERGTEDYFSEIVAFLLRNNAEVFSVWLSSLYKDFPKDVRQYEVNTQVSFALGRPDFVIRVVGEKGYEILLIESKIGSTEGPNQLARYAQILCEEYPDAQKRRLLFVTRGLEPKEEVFRQPVFDGIRWKQASWSSFYSVLRGYLQKHPQDLLVKEVIHFMKEQHMSDSDQFSLNHLVALSNLESLLKIMDRTLDAEIRSKFKTIAGKVQVSDLNETHTRYTLHKQWNMHQGGSGYYGVGFYFLNSDVSNYPTLRLHVGIQPKTDPESLRVAAAMKAWSLRPGWRQTETHENYFSVAHIRSLVDFIALENPVQQMKQYLFERLDELCEIKAQHPDLPW